MPSRFNCIKGKMSNPKSITLALESAIAGGSISLLDDGNEIDHWIGHSDVSKAEDLLINIDELVRRNEFTLGDIGLIAISAGPGSFTGIRIGLATALGLKKGLGVPMASVSALEAVALSSAENSLVAVPMGRNSVCLQEFRDRKAGKPPYTLDSESFAAQVRLNIHNKYILHEKLFTPAIELSHVTNFGSNVAHAVGLLAITNPNNTVAPLFISKAAQ